jgi:hypothetical protein
MDMGTPAIVLGHLDSGPACRKSNATISLRLYRLPQARVPMGFGTRPVGAPDRPSPWWVKWRAWDVKREAVVSG